MYLHICGRKAGECRCKVPPRTAEGDGRAEHILLYVEEWRLLSWRVALEKVYAIPELCWAERMTEGTLVQWEMDQGKEQPAEAAGTGKPLTSGEERSWDKEDGRNGGVGDSDRETDDSDEEALGSRTPRGSEAEGASEGSFGCFL